MTAKRRESRCHTSQSRRFFLIAHVGRRQPALEAVIAPGDVAAKVVIESQRLRELRDVKIDGRRHQDEMVAGIAMFADRRERLRKHPAGNESRDIVGGPDADVRARGTTHHGVQQGAFEVTSIFECDGELDQGGYGPEVAD